MTAATTIAQRSLAQEEASAAEATESALEPLSTIQKEGRDAVELLDYALSSGRKVDATTIASILALSTAPAPAETFNAYPAFAVAYSALAVDLAPVTAITLRATCDNFGRRSILAPKQVSEAKLWSRKLWLWTILFSLLILLNENAERILEQGDQAAWLFGSWRARWEVWGPILGTIAPFAYGGLGACAYLLRVCHQYIHDRSFDPMHTPEYQSRMLIGAVSGGTVLLFTKYLQGDGDTIPLSGAALAFLAGYSNDFLFTLIDRIVTAIMPKTTGSEDDAALQRVPPGSLNAPARPVD